MKLKAKKSSIKMPKNAFVFSVAKGALVAVCVSLVLVLLFAFLLKFTNIPESTIKPVNQVIKGLSILIGVFVGLRKSKELGLVSGLLIGLSTQLLPLSSSQSLVECLPLTLLFLLTFSLAL